MTFGNLFFRDILLSVYWSDSECKWSLNCFRCTFQNATYFTCFCVSGKYPLLLKIDQYKDGCYLKHIFGVCLSVSFLFVYIV